MSFGVMLFLAYKSCVYEPPAILEFLLAPPNAPLSSLRKGIVPYIYVSLVFDPLAVKVLKVLGLFF